MIQTRSSRTPAFALIEAVLSIVIVSVMLVAALRTVGAAKAGQAGDNNRLCGLNLAQDLMSEICDKAYSDPNELALFGPEATEIAAGRTAFDDVDDYNGLINSPPRDRSNGVISNLGNWARTCDVAWVNPADLTQTVLTDSGVKRITVTVTYKGSPVAKLVAVRTAGGG